MPIEFTIGATILNGERNARRWARWVWGIILLSPPVTMILVQAAPHQSVDFAEIYQDSQAALASGRLDAESLGFYPPSARPPLMLLALLPLPAAMLVGGYFFAGLYAAALRTLPRSAMVTPPELDSRMWLWLALFVGPWIAGDVAIGQLTSVIVCSTCLAFVLWRQGRTYLAALALAAGVVVKILPAVCLLFFAARRQWRLVGATLLLAVVLALLPGMIIFGSKPFLSGWTTYYDRVVHPKSNLAQMTEPVRWSRPASSFNPALLPTMLRWLSDFPQDDATPFLPVAHLSPVTVQWTYRLVMVMLAGLTVWACRKGQRSSPVNLATQYALVVLFMLLSSPHLGIYFMAAATWPVAVAMGYVARHDQATGRPDRRYLAILWMWGLSLPLLAVPTVRAVGLSPLVLLFMWAVMWRSVLRQSGVDELHGQGNRLSQPSSRVRPAAAV